MARYKVGDFKLRVGRSRTGRGVFACEDIPGDVCIAEYIGRPVKEEELKNDRLKYLFAISKKRMIDGNIPENRARFINHSCRPNCRAEGPNGRVFIMTKRRIKSGEEITYHYGKEYFDLILRKQGCQCAKCRAEKAAKRANGVKQANGAKRTGATKRTSRAGAGSAKTGTAKTRTAKSRTAKSRTAKTRTAKTRTAKTRTTRTSGAKRAAPAGGGTRRARA
jgi:uncharacterized protein